MPMSNPFSLTDKVGLITGGGRGIGAGIARAFVDAGATVALVARTKEQVEAVATELNEGGDGRALALTADVTDLDALPALVERTVDEFGGLDVVVNNAGGGADLAGPFLDTTAEQLESAFHFNVTAPFALVQAATPRLLERPGSSVVNIVSGAIAKPTRGYQTYDASKGALLYATRSMAAALGPRVRVNGIHPGIIATEVLQSMFAGREGVLEHLASGVRLRRLGTPYDIGLAAVYLASPAASYVTGAMLEVDGGPVGEMQQMFPDL